MNIFTCPTKGCDYEVRAIALAVQHRCKHANNKQVKMNPKLQPEVALSESER